MTTITAIQSEAAFMRGALDQFDSLIATSPALRCPASDLDDSLQDLEAGIFDGLNDATALLQTAQEQFAKLDTLLFS